MRMYGRGNVYRRTDLRTAVLSCPRLISRLLHTNTRTPPAVEQEVMAVQDLAKHGINQADIAKLQEVRRPCLSVVVGPPY